MAGTAHAKNKKFNVNGQVRLSSSIGDILREKQQESKWSNEG